MSESYIQLPTDSTGKKARAIYRSDLGSYEEVEASKHIEQENPIYAVAVSGSSVSANKHHLSIWNGSSYYIRILRIIVAMHETATVSGYIMQYILQRASAISSGTALTIVKLDNRDPDIPSGISAVTGATVTLKEAPISIFALNPEETGAFPFIKFDPPKPIVIAPSEGITIQQYSTAGAGVFNAVIYFSVEVIKP
jgi:hypothetical protein